MTKKQLREQKREAQRVKEEKEKGRDIRPTTDVRTPVVCNPPDGLADAIAKWFRGRQQEALNFQESA